MVRGTAQTLHHVRCPAGFLFPELPQFQFRYGAGEIRFDYETGREFATGFVDYRIRGMEGVEDIRLDLNFEDDYTGYQPGSPTGVPAVTATLVLECEDLFGLPFLTVTSLQRQSRYEIQENPFV